MEFTNRQTMKPYSEHAGVLIILIESRNRQHTTGIAQGFFTPPPQFRCKGCVILISQASKEFLSQYTPLLIRQRQPCL